MFRRVAALAMVSIAAVAAIVSLILSGSSSQLSFAAVVEKVAQTRSVTFSQTMRIPGKPAETDRVLLLANGLTRLELADGDYTVMDLKSGRALVVSPRNKKARVMLGLNVPPGRNPYDMLRNVVNDSSMRLPDEMIGGSKASVFRVESTMACGPHADMKVAMKVWVNPQTKLPIRMEAVPTDAKDGPPPAMDGFVFDQALDPSLFSLNPPEGYAVTTEGSAHFPAPPNDADLLAPRVIPGVGLGPVKFGMSKEEVAKILGKPDIEEVGSFQYPSRGYGFLGSPRRGVAAITCFSQAACAFKVRDFAGKTKEGIGIGSSLKDLEKAFGKPDSIKTNGPMTKHVRFNKLDLDFTLFSDKVVSFILWGPRPQTDKAKWDGTK